MDILLIILAVAACIAALLVLYFMFALIVFLVAANKAKSITGNTLGRSIPRDKLHR